MEEETKMEGLWMANENTHKKRSIKLDIIGLLALLVAVGALYLEYKYDEPIVDIQDSFVNIDYLKSMRDDQNIYPMFTDEIHSENVFYGSCATQVLISNENDDEILVSKLMLETKEIKVDKTPRLVLDLYGTNNGGAMFYIWNEGWGNAHDIVISFEGKNADLDAFLPQEKQSISIPLVRHGGNEELLLWRKEDLLSTAYNTGLQISAVCKDSTGKEVDLRYLMEADSLYTTVFNGRFFDEGRGAASEHIYGIQIDTSEEEDFQVFTISESVSGRSRLELPICFAPDKSCEFQFRIKMEIITPKNEKRVIETKFAKVKFQVSSTDKLFLCGDDYDQDELRSMLEPSDGLTTISYPYVDLETLKENDNLEYE